MSPMNPAARLGLSQGHCITNNFTVDRLAHIAITRQESRVWNEIDKESVCELWRVLAWVRVLTRRVCVRLCVRLCVRVCVRLKHTHERIGYIIGYPPIWKYTDRLLLLCSRATMFECEKVLLPHVKTGNRLFSTDNRHFGSSVVLILGEIE